MNRKIIVYALVTLFVVPHVSYAEYKLQPNDQIEISVLGQPELSKKIFIMPDGKISFPLIGEVEAAGFTPPELIGILKERLKVYLPIADININVVKGRTVKVYILGEINKPGEYFFEPQDDISLLKILAVSGGTSQKANTKKIEIIRSSGQRETVNMNKAIEEKDKLKLADGDTVLVKHRRMIDFATVSSFSLLIYAWISIIVLSRSL